MVFFERLPNDRAPAAVVMRDLSEKDSADDDLWARSRIGGAVSAVRHLRYYRAKYSRRRRASGDKPRISVSAIKPALRMCS